MGCPRAESPYLFGFEIACFARAGQVPPPREDAFPSGRRLIVRPDRRHRAYGRPDRAMLLTASRDRDTLWSADREKG
jgi:hypothetical protein